MIVPFICHTTIIGKIKSTEAHFNGCIHRTFCSNKNGAFCLVYWAFVAAINIFFPAFWKQLTKLISIYDFCGKTRFIFDFSFSFEYVLFITCILVCFCWITTATTRPLTYCYCCHCCFCGAISMFLFVCWECFFFFIFKSVFYCVTYWQTFHKTVLASFICIYIYRIRFLLKHRMWCQRINILPVACRFLVVLVVFLLFFLFAFRRYTDVC